MDFSTEKLVLAVDESGSEILHAELVNGFVSSEVLILYSAPEHFGK